jgi:hypothetical protein
MGKGCVWGFGPRPWGMSLLRRSSDRPETKLVRGAGETSRLSSTRFVRPSSRVLGSSQDAQKHGNAHASRLLVNNGL